MAHGLAKALALPNSHLLIPSIGMITRHATAPTPGKRLFSCVIPVRLKEVPHPGSASRVSSLFSSSLHSLNSFFNSSCSAHNFYSSQAASSHSPSASSAPSVLSSSSSATARRAPAQPHAQAHSASSARIFASSVRRASSSAASAKKPNKKAPNKKSQDSSSSSSSSDSDDEDSRVKAKKSSSSTGAKPETSKSIPEPLISLAQRDEVLAYLQEPKKIRFGLLKVIVTIILGVYFGAFLAKFSANLLEEYEIFVKGDDDDD